MAYQDNPQYRKREDEFISAPVRSVWKGNTFIKIPVGREGKAWGFGLAKAKAILEHIKFIEDYVRETEQKRITEQKGM